jgi:hypothetical protein
MKRIESLAAAHPRVGAVLSPEAAVLRGQLSSLGFTPCDAGEPGLDWLVTDGSTEAPAGVPVLRVTGKVSIYGLRQAIISLFDSQKD